MGATKAMQKSKEAKMIAATASGKSKKKWGKGKVQERLSNAVMFDEPTFNRMLKEIPKAKLVTPSVISERLRVNGSVAREAIKYLVEQGRIEQVGDKHHAQMILTRKIDGDEA